MNRTLRRPMFRIGGTAEGLTSGLAPRQGYQGTNNASDQRAQPIPRTRTGLRDFLIDFGLDLASRPPSGSIFSTAAAAAKDPFKQYQAGKAAREEREYERQWEQEGRDIEQKRFEKEMGLKREEIDLTERLHEGEMGFKEKKLTYEQVRDEADRKLQKHLGEIEAKGKQQWLVEELDKYWNAKISAGPPEERARLQAQKEADKYKVYEGYDVSDKMAILRNTAAFEEASDLARQELDATINPDTELPWTRGDKGYSEKVIELTNRYLRQLADFLEEEKKATGGRVGYQNAGAVMPGQPMQAQAQPMQASMPMNQAAGPTDQETNQINISYEQLRERLPQEISNEIVLLLSESYEAFADFAEIQTQADVNEFNTKYNVQLFLPKQAGA